MDNEEVLPMNNEERLARVFHAVYERLAPEFGYETRAETREFDPESANGRLMMAVCQEVIDAIPNARLWLDGGRVKETGFTVHADGVELWFDATCRFDIGRDGSLAVISPESSSPVALYAPGRWICCVVDRDKEWKRTTQKGIF